jgi:hypothetical protein
MDFQQGDILAIVGKCQMHRMYCTINYQVTQCEPNVFLEKVNNDCVFMGTHYCSSQIEEMDDVVLTYRNGQYELESWDHETNFGVTEVRIIK